MQQLMEIWNKYRIYLLILAIIIVITGYLFIGKEQKDRLPISNTNAVVASSVSESNGESSSINLNTKGVVAIDIKGAVQKPGVYQLKADSRVNEALTAAGGPLVNADLRQVNLAKQLTDQQMIYIPTIGEVPPISSSAADTLSSNSGNSNSPMVNINTATKEQLCQITGIGDKKADLILQYRQEHGQFKSVDELKEINGFGEKTVAKLKDHLTV
ncbi:helix-hairpin-helix domain-containing protein [Limosilactobacillus sp. STM2_1]|uniref:Helix-hairpin-helix domain-containing protein n=1 Tax=Limosilactobacillus rudii TaxID=2759755 RepID=A0A7W3UKD8_9LACO|nr:helix-hairpin-helix domain-containing protein [Limosilactobacillus rudii]MBB1078588.1 helix-hairpin-helix domain-containing protein [Limosilactobacillus rudii]MBB1097228.1 helix-hairpin-helix domain-containing protein [Limosilactobacillus rudii]MCD7133856.1 helix-hairpin-helix domain-containing protein [Limosilactobacillus rudii]